MTDARHEFAESAAAYALGALDASERARFEAHLPTCDICQEEVDKYRSVTAGIGGTVEPMVPPAALKARVIAAATSQRRGRAFEPPGLSAKAPVARPTT